MLKPGFKLFQGLRNGFKLFSILASIMTCDKIHQVDRLFLPNETYYMVDVAEKRMKRTPEQIAAAVKEEVPCLSEENIKNLWGVSADEFAKLAVPNLIAREDFVFGDKTEAFMPSKRELFASSNELMDAYAELTDGLDPSVFKFVYSKVNGSILKAHEEMYRSCGINMFHAELPTAGQWQQKVDNLVNMAKKLPFVSEAYLAGSAARGAERSKDVDILTVVSECPGECEMCTAVKYPSQEFGFRVGGPGAESYFPVDVFCFKKKEFHEIVKGGYPLVKDRKLLFKK
jgi:hypothetical protein